jgi:hypothetical protein
MITSIEKALRSLSLIAAILSVTGSGITHAQALEPKEPKASVLPTGGGQALFDTSDVAILLLDHQSGLFQTVQDIEIADLRRNVEMLARLANLLDIPVITTASEPAGPNGPLMPEIDELAPHAVYVPRKGEVNAWDNEDSWRR